MTTKAFNTWGFLGTAALAATALLTACGGGSSTPAATTLSGTAAVGVPIVGGIVTVNCASGSTLTSKPTGSTGGWTVTISDQKLPCATQITGGTVGGVLNTTNYHSIAISFGTVNITPLTDLVVAQMTGATPANWFEAPVFTAVNATALDTALTKVVTDLGLKTTLDKGKANPFTTAFVPNNGVLMDDVLEAIKSTLANASVNKTYAELLAAAAAKDFSTFSGFSTAFSTIYVDIAPATGGTVAGAGTLTIVTSISGFAAPSVVVTGVPKPTGTSDFCSAVKDQSSYATLTSTAGFKLTDCTFSGNVGTITATVLSIPYTVTYTYS